MSGHGTLGRHFLPVQSVLESLTANQCSALTSAALQLPKTMPLKDLSLSGEHAILDLAQCAIGYLTA